MSKMLRYSCLGWAFGALFALLPGPISAAPVVPVPGEASGFLYFPPSLSAAVSAHRTETIGRITMFPALPLPDGWMECDGSTVSAAAYPELVEYLAGAAAMSATLPDLRGVFLRGNDSGRGVDPGRTPGTYQESANRSHTHTGVAHPDGAHTHPGSSTSLDGRHRHSNYYAFVGNGAGSGTMASPNRTSGKWASWPKTGTTMSTEPDHTHPVSTSLEGSHTHAVQMGPMGGPEARPRNISVIFAIRVE
jgi:microcystin-dependent protein